VKAPDDAPGLRARVAWRGALIASFLNAFGWPLDLLISREVPGMPKWPALTSASIGLVTATVLLARRRTPTRTLGAIAFLINTAAVASMLWLVNGHYAVMGSRWAPFQANKLGAMTVGLLTPEPWVGIVSLVAYGGSAVAQWIGFPAPLKHALPVGEPWATVGFAAFGLVLLLQQSGRLRLERELARRQEEIAALDRLAHAFLAVRDFANSPLQTITCAAALVRIRHPDMKKELDLIGRSIERLRQLDDLLARYIPPETPTKEVSWRLDRPA
jgi:hypothetical protein